MLKNANHTLILPQCCPFSCDAKHVMPEKLLVLVGLSPIQAQGQTSQVLQINHMASKQILRKREKIKREKEISVVRTSTSGAPTCMTTWIWTLGPAFNEEGPRPRRSQYRPAQRAVRSVMIFIWRNPSPPDADVAPHADVAPGNGSNAVKDWIWPR